MGLRCDATAGKEEIVNEILGGRGDCFELTHLRLEKLACNLRWFLAICMLTHVFLNTPECWKVSKRVWIDVFEVERLRHLN